MQIARGEQEILLYEPEPGEKIDLLDLAIRKYSCILLREGSYRLHGEKSHSVSVNIRIADQAHVRLTLDHVNLNGPTEPCIRLGSRSDLILELVGQNTLNRDAIAVPPDSKLTVTGKGNLLVHNTRNFSVGIGANYNDPFGTICLETEGRVTIRSSGNKTACIGGGVSAGEGSRIRGGILDLNTSGVNALGIGSVSGEVTVTIENTDLSIHGEGNDALLLGSVSGDANISVSDCGIRLFAACERATGVGTMSGTADVLFSGGTVSATMHCDAGAILGTFSGEAKVIFRDAKVSIHGEGNRLAGFGSLTGACDTRVESGRLSGDLLAGERYLIGSAHSRFMVTGGNVQLYPEGSNVPVSPCGAPLTFVNPEGDHFERTFTDRRATWTYKADRNAEGYLGVWIPY